VQQASTWAQRQSAPRSISAPRGTRRSLSLPGIPTSSSAGHGDSAWCSLCVTTHSRAGQDYHVFTDLTGQPNHPVSRFRPTHQRRASRNNGGYNAHEFGKTSPLVYEIDDRSSDRSVRYQVGQLYMDRCGLITPGGASSGSWRSRRGRRTAVVTSAPAAWALSAAATISAPDGRGSRTAHAIQASIWIRNYVALFR